MFQEDSRGKGEDPASTETGAAGVRAGSLALELHRLSISEVIWCGGKSLHIRHTQPWCPWAAGP